MTTPTVETVNVGGVRYYVHPETKQKAPGVTSVLNTLPKPWLSRWAAKSVAENAIELLPEVVGMATKGKHDAAVDLLKRSPWRDTGQAAEQGDAVHELAEKLFAGQRVGRVSKDIKVFKEHIAEFMEQAQPEFLYQEATVWGPDGAYSGTFDWMAYILGKHLGAEDEDADKKYLVLGDTKTTRSGIHEEVCLQLNAYAAAPHIILPDGTLKEMPQIDGLAVFHLTRDQWTLTPVDYDDIYMEIFMALLNGPYKWDKELKQHSIGAPILGSNL